MFSKQVYWTVFVSVVSFFRELSPGKALADYFYLDGDFRAVPTIPAAAQALSNKQSCALVSNLINPGKSGVLCRQLVAEEMLLALSLQLHTAFVVQHNLHPPHLQQTAITAKGARWEKGWVGGSGPSRLAEAEIKRCSAASLRWCSHWSGTRLISNICSAQYLALKSMSQHSTAGVLGCSKEPAEQRRGKSVPLSYWDMSWCFLFSFHLSRKYSVTESTAVRISLTSGY